jgi:hypothetical protein
MEESDRDQRESIRGMLRMLGSVEEQLAYERAVPWVDITNELVCMWFDDTYHPDSEEFRAHFSPAELETLATFDAFYDECLRELPDRPGTVRTWLACPAWREIMQKARDTLALLGM